MRTLIRLLLAGTSSDRSSRSEACEIGGANT